MKKRFIIFVSRIVFKHLFKLVLEEEFLRTDQRGNVWYNGKVLTKEQRIDIKDQAQLIIKQPLFMMLVKEMQYVASRRMYHDSKDEIDMLGGKMLLYLIDVLCKKLYNIGGLK